MKSTNYFILAIVWLLVSLMWFFCEKNIPMGIVWLLVAAAYGIIAAVKHRNGKHGT
jgi:F0F1-type ATP synthase assembly protein I